MAILQATLAELETLKSGLPRPGAKGVQEIASGVRATSPVLQNRCSVYESNPFRAEVERMELA